MEQAFSLKEREMRCAEQELAAKMLRVEEDLAAQDSRKPHADGELATQAAELRSSKSSAAAAYDSEDLPPLRAADEDRLIEEELKTELNHQITKLDLARKMLEEQRVENELATKRLTSNTSSTMTSAPWRSVV